MPDSSEDVGGIGSGERMPDGRAWAQRFSDGDWGGFLKNRVLSLRCVRGKASMGGAALGPPILAGFYAVPLYQEDGVAGLGYLALTLVAYCVGVLAMKSRTEMRQVDKKEKEDYTNRAVAFYEARKDKIPAPK